MTEPENNKYLLHHHVADQWLIPILVRLNSCGNLLH